MASSVQGNHSMNRKRERFPYHQWLSILSWLPAKSLTRFRCVAKPWNILISDSNFVELHRLRSLLRKEGTGLVVAFKHASSTLSILTTDYQGTPRKHPAISSIYDRFSQIVHGLVCLSGNWNCNINPTIYNIFTNEYLPLPSSNLNVRYILELSVMISSSYLLGFDSNARVYKVLNICTFVNPGSVISYQFEIFTLGVDTSWREIKAPKYGFSSPSFAHSDSIYVNGSVCWIQSLEGNRRFIELFNMKHERFHQIDFPLDAVEMYCNLIRIQAHLAIAMWPIKTNDSKSILKLWISEGRYKRQHVWTLKTIIVPDSLGFSNPYIIGSTLTGDVMIMDNSFSEELKLVFYDLRNNSIKGIALLTSLLHSINGNSPTPKQWSRFSHNMFRQADGYELFRLSIMDSEENIYPLKKKRKVKLGS
ncbi:hypothetical protein ACFE04_002322 [Oxalis oulophora]